MVHVRMRDGRRRGGGGAEDKLKRRGIDRSIDERGIRSRQRGSRRKWGQDDGDRYENGENGEIMYAMNSRIDDTHDFKSGGMLNMTGLMGTQQTTDN